MKKLLILLSSSLVAFIFVGCNKQLNTFYGIPNTKEEMVTKSDDKELSQAMSKFMDGNSNPKIDIRVVKDGTINLYIGNFINFQDNITDINFNSNFLSILEKSQVVKTYLDVATKRGNKVKAYKGESLVLYTLYDKDIQFPVKGDNVITIDYASPTYIEYDKNNRFVSILLHMHSKYYAFNNPDGNISLDTNFYILTGSKAKAVQTFLRNKSLEEDFLFNAN